MKCKNCGCELWLERGRDWLPTTPRKGVEFSIYWHDWKEKGVYHTCKCGCENPEPEASQGERAEPSSASAFAEGKSKQGDGEKK